jgi:hypothetical protein
VTAHFRQRRVIDHQHGVIPAHQPLGLKARHVPQTRRDEMMQPIKFAGIKSRRHRLHALAVSWTDQARNVAREPASPRAVTKPSKE